eukprot:5825387-Lingulodinium_polyedra.AAC.1
MDNLRGIMKSGPSPGAACGQSGATELKFSPFLPLNSATPPHAGACGRVGSAYHTLLAVFDARR